MTKSNILIVDDDRQSIELLAETLSSYGHATSFLVEAQYLFQKLEAHPVDLILMDIHMPAIDGVTLLKQIKKHPVFRRTPVIMVSGQGDEKILSSCFELGAMDFISKPIGKLELRARVKTALEITKYISQLSELNAGLEQKVRERTSELKESFERFAAAREQFSKKLVESQEEERKRIAAELHDGLGQDLLAIRNGIKRYLNTLSEQNGPAAELGQVADFAVQSINGVREIAFNLYPCQLYQLGLKAAMESMIEKTARHACIKISFFLPELSGLFPKDMEIHIYRIIQEGLNNIVKHSGASKAGISMKRNGKSLRIRVRDNGKGFEVRPERDGFGLRGIGERVKILGGALAIESSTGGGATIKIRIER